MAEFLCDKDVQHCGACPACARNAKPGLIGTECVWRQDNDGYWLTGCGDHPWQYETGGPSDNHQIFCHRCGGKVVVEA